MKQADALDAVDRRILTALAANARISMTELGRLVHLSRPAVQARVARLETEGIIRGYRADIRLADATDSPTALLLATIGVRPCAPALDYIMAQPEVRSVWSVAGPHDAVIEVATSDGAALSALTDRLAASPFRIEAEARTVLRALFRPSAPAPKGD